MKITYINCYDLPGRAFNGYDLHDSLNQMGHRCRQFVLQKQSRSETVLPILSKNRLHVHERLKKLEWDLGISNLVYPYADDIAGMPDFRFADIVHYQLIHNNVISFTDLKRLFQLKSGVWTIHDPGFFTGNCIYPLDCEGWKTGCENCDKNRGPVLSSGCVTHSVWKLKKGCFQNLPVDFVVATDFMLQYFRASPLMELAPRIHKIPFGVDMDAIACYPAREAKEALQIPPDSFVIAFRDADSPLKGVSFLLEALRKIPPNRVVLLTVGSGDSVRVLKSRFPCISLGWQNDKRMMDLFYSAADIFVMPSLAETFGLMAIEAMAHQCTVLCFQNTVLEEVTHAPECGVAVLYKNADALSHAMEFLMRHPRECIRRGELGRQIVGREYSYSRYVNRHLELYREVLERDRAARDIP